MSGVVRYIADTHLYDAYSMDWRSSYRTLDNYAVELVRNWNAVVEPDDIVIHVGDIGFYCQRTLDILRLLKGQKILVIGNHDINWGNAIYDCGVFIGVYDRLESGGVTIEHIPNTELHEYYYIHGHHHKYDVPNMNDALKAYVADTYRLNCAADLIGNKPVTLQELAMCKEVMIDEFRSRHLI